jgi:hypothetical protein
MELPADIAKADNCIPVGLDGNHYRSTLRQYIAAALAAERVSEREACAKIADPRTHHARGKMSTDMRKPGEIAAAIRSQP